MIGNRVVKNYCEENLVANYTKFLQTIELIFHVATICRLDVTAQTNALSHQNIKPEQIHRIE